MWWWSDNQLNSAQILLRDMEEEANIFIKVIDGVTALAWGLLKIAKYLHSQIVVVAIDATCKLYIVII
jgi:hypothetical protein